MPLLQASFGNVERCYRGKDDSSWSLRILEAEPRLASGFSDLESGIVFSFLTLLDSELLCLTDSKGNKAPQCELPSVLSTVNNEAILRSSKLLLWALPQTQKRCQHLLIDTHNTTSPTYFRCSILADRKGNLSDEIDLVLVLGKIIFDFPPGFMQRPLSTDRSRFCVSSGR